MPIQQAETFVQRASEAGATAKLVIHAGGAHGWAGMEKDMAVMADWFDEHLRGVKK